MTSYLLIITYFLLSSLFIFLTFKIKMKFLTPSTIYTLIWSIIGIISIINYVPIIQVSFLVHFFIVGSIIVFNLYYLSFSLKKKPNTRITNDADKFNYKILYFLFLGGLILISPNFIQAINIMVQSGFDMTLVRVTNYRLIDNNDNVFYGLLTRSVPFAITTVMSIVASININKGNNKMLLMSIVLVIIYTITYGGRFPILNFISFYIGAYLMLSNTYIKKINKKYIFIPVVLLVLMSILRGSDLKSFIEMAIIYFVGSLSFLELILTNPQNFDLSNDTLPGYLTFAFLIEPIILVSKFLGLTNMGTPSYYFNSNAQIFYNIGDKGEQIFINNNTTFFYNFIYDFGYIGPIFAVLLLAITVVFFERRYSSKGELNSLMIMVYLYSVIITSPMMYALNSINSSLIFFLIFLVSKKSKITWRKYA